MKLKEYIDRILKALPEEAFDIEISVGLDIDGNVTQHGSRDIASIVNVKFDNDIF